MSLKRKKPEQPQEEGSPAWMNTYGDMVTLVLTFFVLLFSFSSIDAEKWEKLVSSFTGTHFVAIEALDPSQVGGPNEGASGEDDVYAASASASASASAASGLNAGDSKERFNALYQSIKAHIQENKLEAELNVERTGDVILLHVTDSALFDSGKDEIKPVAKKMLKTVSEIFGRYEQSIKAIRIEGHTDNEPIHTAKFESNLVLSCSRAATVWQYFIDTADIEPGRYSATGYGEYHPIASNKTKEGKAKNRRVDFVIEGLDNLD
jgi:chemotaxis protein MotB